MTGRTEDIQPVMVAIANEVTRLRSCVPAPGQDPKRVTTTVELQVLERLVDWWDETPACACPCHRDQPPPGLVHQQPCCDAVTEVQVIEEQEELRSRQLAEWATLPLYQEGARCPKCGNESAGTFFCSKSTRVASTAFGGRPFTCEFTAPGQRDHMHRVCERCTFPWTERPMDDGEVGS